MTGSDPLEALEIETGPAPRAAVIWMHGLGADGHDFEPIVPALGLPATLPVRFVFPHAPLRPVTINAGMVMRAWYDVRDDGGERREDEGGVRASQRQIQTLMAREQARGVPAGRLVLAGFSQGGAMALHTGLRHPERLAGILALSCFLPLADALAAEADVGAGAASPPRTVGGLPEVRLADVGAGAGSPPRTVGGLAEVRVAARDVPILMAHGTEDTLIPLGRARRSRDVLLGLGYKVVWREYRMPHAVSAEEVSDIGAWLRGTLGP
jgi:phospholipase/carboxylesterase